MRYYARYDENNSLTMIGTNCGGLEITEEEYNRLLDNILKKASLVTQLYTGEITINDVPVEWQEEIQRRVNEYIALNGIIYDSNEATVEDYQDALNEFGVKV